MRMDGQVQAQAVRTLGETWKRGPGPDYPYLGSCHIVSGVYSSQGGVDDAV